jgi:hypothetical protein
VVTIPLLALIAFLLIALGAAAVWRRGGPLPLGTGRPWLRVAATIGLSVGVMLLLMLALPAARFSWLGGG